MADIVQLFEKASTDVVDLPDYHMKLKVRKVFSEDLLNEHCAAINALEPKRTDKGKGKAKKKSKYVDMSTLSPDEILDLSRFQTVTVCAGVTHIDVGDGWQDLKLTDDLELVDKSNPQAPTLHIASMPDEAVVACFEAIRKLDDDGRMAEALGSFRRQPKAVAVD